jgi:hypothetical protein
MVKRMEYGLYFDKEATDELKTGKFLIYRSKEKEDDESIISGLYIQSTVFLLEPIPEDISITLKY